MSGIPSLSFPRPVFGPLLFFRSLFCTGLILHAARPVEPPVPWIMIVCGTLWARACSTVPWIIMLYKIHNGETIFDDAVDGYFVASPLWGRVFSMVLWIVIVYSTCVGYFQQCRGGTPRGDSICDGSVNGYSLRHLYGREYSRRRH